MRTVAEYLGQGGRVRRLANAAPQPGLRKRYADLAECYRLLATERERMIEQGALAVE